MLFLNFFLNFIQKFDGKSHMSIQITLYFNLISTNIAQFFTRSIAEKGLGMYFNIFLSKKSLKQSFVYKFY